MLFTRSVIFSTSAIRRAVEAGRTVGVLAMPDRRVLCKMALPLAFACLMTAPMSHAAGGGSQDSWTGQDKALHFGMSAPMGLLGVSFAARLGFTDATEKKVVGALIGSMPGLVKELADISNPRGTASIKDLAFNLLGAALGASLSDCCTVSPISRRDRLDGLTVEYRIDF